MKPTPSMRLLWKVMEDSFILQYITRGYHFVNKSDNRSSHRYPHVAVGDATQQIQDRDGELEHPELFFIHDKNLAKAVAHHLVL